MAISVESTSTRILVNISDNRGPFILQRARGENNRTWLTLTVNGFADIPYPLPEEEKTPDTDNEEIEAQNEIEEPIKPLVINAGDFIDSFDLTDGLYEYRYVPTSITNPQGKDWTYTEWVKFGQPNKIGYTFRNYKVPEGGFGEILTPDDIRYTYLWGTDFKATNGEYFTDEQIRFFIDEAVCYLERKLNITIIRKRFASQAEDRGLIQGEDYDEEEAAYDFDSRKISRYVMIQTKHRPIINVSKCELMNRGGNNQDLMDSIVVDRAKGKIKAFHRPFIPNDTMRGITKAIGRYGDETLQRHIFYLVDYEAGYKNSDLIPKDLRQIIGKVIAISLLNIIGDGLMSGFSSSSLSMDGISESFSSTQSATSAYFGARIAVYQKEVENYIKENKYRFGFMPINTL